MVEFRIRAQEQKIRECQVVIEALRHEWGELLNDADRYDRYQPKPADDEDERRQEIDESRAPGALA